MDVTLHMVCFIFNVSPAGKTTRKIPRTQLHSYDGIIRREQRQAKVWNECVTAGGNGMDRQKRRKKEATLRIRLFGKLRGQKLL